MAEQRAAQYFAVLQEQVTGKTYLPKLLEDIQQWKRKHMHHGSWLSFFSRRKEAPDASDYYKYIGWLKYTGKLDDYLERSISYLYLRDLGQDLRSPHTQIRMKRMMGDMKKLLIRPDQSSGGSGPEFLSLAALYRWAQSEGVEKDAIWVIHKLQRVNAHIPSGMNGAEAQRKLIKIIAGVVLHVVDEMDDNVSHEIRARRLGEAIRLGYYYGLTYPFIDDLLDSNVLDPKEKEAYSELIRTVLVQGTVPEFGHWNGNHAEMIQFVYHELGEAYEYIKNYQSLETQLTFFEQSYVFFHSQDVDRFKDLNNPNYTNDELYLPIIIKSSSSRLIVRSVIRANKNEGFDQRVFYFGLYNQLADDFADLFEDMKDGAVTPYTYYWTYRNERPDLINPFELYWAVIGHLIYHVYQSDAEIREIMLGRAANGLKRLKKRLGAEKFNEMMEVFSVGSPELNGLIEQMAHKAENVDFFDKLLRDQLLISMQKQREEKQQFERIVQNAREEINQLLEIQKPEHMPSMKELLIDTANYSLAGSGKRIRPVLAWIMGVSGYGLQASSLTPLFRTLEYMHTASLIFDDLPSQDNSSFRRGRPTLHQVHDSAIAELTGLYLIQKAMEELASIQGFDRGAVLELLRYTSQKAGEICMGQAMDLQSKGKVMTPEQLNMLCYYKTGIAFEVSLVAPAILAQVKESEIAVLKKIAYHAGIAFQIKDDLLDADGDLQLLGKPAGKDVENNHSTFVTVLGQEGASMAMWEHYCLAMEALKELPREVGFLKHILSYLIIREN
ncbi:polyprenyl synthetase family protein [Marinicrinis lubricantis]